MGHQVRTVDAEIATIAGRTHGVITRSRLLAAGVTPKQITVRVARGSLLAVHRGVYRVGHTAPSVAATYLAAVMACGHGALLAGRAAAWWLGIVGGEPPPPEVVAPTERRVPGVRTRRCRGLRRSDGRVHGGIPVTSAARTLVDLAAVLALDDLSTAAHRAAIRYRTTPRQVVAQLTRHPSARGRANLELVIGRRVRVTLSRLERSFLRVLRGAGLRLPDETNRPAGGRLVDCRWFDPPLTVELDSFTFNNTRQAFERDRQREREAYARGDQFRRYTYGDVLERPERMLAELAALLS